MVTRSLRAGPRTQEQIESAVKAAIYDRGAVPTQLLPADCESWKDAVADALAELRFDFDLIDFDSDAAPDLRLYSLRRGAHNQERKRA